jgi:proteasome lid subunit RPN8/RPN11
VGDRTSVQLEVRCPHGCRALGIFHTHPGGTPYPSDADKREARRLGLHHMCIGTPQDGNVICHVI